MEIYHTLQVTWKYALVGLEEKRHPWKKRPPWEKNAPFPCWNVFRGLWQTQPILFLNEKSLKIFQRLRRAKATLFLIRKKGSNFSALAAGRTHIFNHKCCVFVCYMCGKIFSTKSGKTPPLEKNAVVNPDPNLTLTLTPYKKLK